MKNAHLAFLSLELMMNLVLSYTVVQRTVVLLSSMRGGNFVFFVHCFVLSVENIARNRCSRNIE